MKRLLIPLFLIFSSAVLCAQDIVSDTQGFNITLSADYAKWSSDYWHPLDEYDPNGYGGGLRVGYGFNQRFEVYARFDAHNFRWVQDISWNKYTKTNLEAGLRLNIGGTLQRLRPFFEVGYGRQTMILDPIYYDNDPVAYAMEMQIPGLALAGGVNYFLNPNWALNASVGGSFGKAKSFFLNGLRYLDEPDFSTLKGNVGVTFFIH